MRQLVSKWTLDAGPGRRGGLPRTRMCWRLERLERRTTRNG